MGAGRDKRKKQRAEKHARKAMAMTQPGFKSKYALRQKARLRGVPMAARSGEQSPWWTKLASCSAPPPPVDPYESARRSR